jgi:hypothetical protein
MNDTFGRRWVSAPYQSERQTGSIDGVWLAPGEDVEWIWSYGPDGSRVTGYTTKYRIVEGDKYEQTKLG